MEHLLPYTLLALAIIGLATAAVRLKRRLVSKNAELSAFEGEEQRMFTFLHELGSAIGSDTTMNGLSRLIVDGVNRVVAARGGAAELAELMACHARLGQLLEGSPPPLLADCADAVAEAVLAADGDPFAQVILDPNGDGAIAFGVSGVPETFLVDADGQIVKSHRGPLGVDAATEMLARYRALVATPTPKPVG
jgi:hypothetical protein